jgi:hypothetical protein
MELSKASNALLSTLGSKQELSPKINNPRISFFIHYEKEFSDGMVHMGKIEISQKRWGNRLNLPNTLERIRFVDKHREHIGLKKAHKAGELLRVLCNYSVPSLVKKAFKESFKEVTKVESSSLASQLSTRKFSPSQV